MLFHTIIGQLSSKKKKKKQTSNVSGDEDLGSTTLELFHRQSSFVLKLVAMQSKTCKKKGSSVCFVKRREKKKKGKDKQGKLKRMRLAESSSTAFLVDTKMITLPFSTRIGRVCMSQVHFSESSLITCTIWVMSSLACWVAFQFVCDSACSL